jgi:hypothetical protein
VEEMNNHEYYQRKKLSGYFTKKKEKRNGILQKFFDLRRFSAGEDYYNY